jgi:hypothetical protein
MEQTRLDIVCEHFYKLLDLDNQSFEYIVSSYDSTLFSLFSDKIYNRGRYYVADYFASFIAKRATHVDRILLLRALREKLKLKWRSSSDL